jgi:outer membrane murein-binding lipoprotein Lpp
MRAKLIAIGAVAVLALGVAGCSDDDDDSSDATPTPSVCDQADTLEQSVEDLANLDVISSGTDGLTSAVDQVKTDAEALRQTVSADIEPEVDALTTVIDDAQNTLSNIDSDAKLSEKIADVEAAFTGIATAAMDLKSALDNECA